MSVPGSNLLKRAARLIKQQTVNFYQDLGRINNEIGVDVTNYDNPVAIQGSLQAVPQNAYQDLGLDFGKNYVTFYTNTLIIGVDRDVSGDVFTYDGKVYKCRSITPWIAQDGWNSVLAVQTEVGDPQFVKFVITPSENVTYVVAP